MENILNNSRDFYFRLPVITNFYEMANQKYYVSPPEDWYLIIADIKNSTQAIQEGRYKDVNISSVLCIVAIANLLKTLEYPFVFGGDGVTLLIHSTYLEEAKDILFSLKQLILENFNLEIRIGGISIAELRDKQLSLKIAKLQISKCYYQALFSGDAIDYVENSLKKEEIIFLEKRERKQVDLTGFSCRWEDIETLDDCCIALIIKIIETKNQEKILEMILSKLKEIYKEIDNWHPVAISNMKTISLDSQYVKLEANLTNSKKSFFNVLKIIVQLILVKFFTRLPFKIGVEVNYQDITEIKKMNYVSSDFKKLEGSLKLILRSSHKQKDLFINFLESLYNQKKITYGFYTDQKVHITCSVFLDKKQDVHFIDVVNGGFTNAAKMLKEKEKQIKN